MNKDKFFRGLGKFAAVILVFMWINDIWVWIARNGLISFVDSGAIYSWLYVLLYTFVYAVPVAPLLYYCFRKKIN